MFFCFHISFGAAELLLFRSAPHPFPKVGNSELHSTFSPYFSFYGTTWVSKLVFQIYAPIITSIDLPAEYAIVLIKQKKTRQNMRFVAPGQFAHK